MTIRTASTRFTGFVSRRFGAREAFVRFISRGDCRSME